mmetsp:Transcript_18479/g.52179  ORF Transcript_18479/g.52179 Transcript_18479/m.52179 type:complete len:97 (-) Transcript_18479:28-318(-)
MSPTSPPSNDSRSPRSRQVSHLGVRRPLAARSMSLSPPSSPSPKPACPPSSADELQPVSTSEVVSSAAPAAGMPPSSLPSGPMGHPNSSVVHRQMI